MMNFDELCHFVPFRLPLLIERYFPPTWYL
jgi:hypothetical protein